jgi:hypothetical protein
MDLAGIDREVDVIVGEQSAKPFGYSTKFELHDSQSIRTSLNGWVGLT